MRSSKLVWRIYLLFLVVGLATFAAMSWYVIYAVHRIYLERVISDLEDRAKLAADQLQSTSEFTVEKIDPFCKRWGEVARTRYTVILPDGTVVGDSAKPPAAMENHRYRPEVIQAMAGKVGHAVRFSQTLHRHFVYVAVPLLKGDRVLAIVRAAVPVHTVGLTTRVIRMQILVGLGLAVFLFASLGIAVSRLVARPLERIQQTAQQLAEGNLDARISPEGSAETIALAESLNRMAKQLKERIDAALRQQRELQAVFSSMEEGVIALDSDLRVLHVNESAKRWLGIHCTECSGHPLVEVVRRLDFVSLVQDIQRRTQPVEREIVIRADDGTVRYFQVRGTPLTDSAGKVFGWVLVMSDITRLKELEMMRRRFVADVSHELKTPITAISGALQTLSADSSLLAPSQRRFVDIIERQTNRMAKLVEDLLCLAAIEHDAECGVVELTPDLVVEPVRRAISLHADSAAKKGLQLLEDLDESVIAPINTALLELAVSNLLDNAIKYSPEGKRIYVSVAARGRACEIAVRDEGIGIAPEHLPNLFQRFYRVDKARSRQLGGTGLGLAIVKHIALAHKGRVFVESEVGKGSTFIIQIPLHHEVD